MTIQFTRGVGLAKIESAFNVAEVPDPATDAFEVINPNFAPEITSQRRAVAAPDLSPFPSLVTRKVGRMTFDLEVKSNGNTGATIPPRIGRLLRACGFEEVQINTAAECVYRVVPDTDNTGDLHFYGSTTTYTGGVYLKIKCTITTGGASGVAVATFEHPAEAIRARGGLGAISATDTDEVILTSGSEVTLFDVDGNEIVRVTPDFQSNNPVTGDVYYIHVRPIGYLYKPISESVPSLTLDIQYPDDSGQSIRHRLTGARGTFTVQAAVGEFPVFSFEFTGSYNDQVDVATVAATFEDQDPAQVEYAALALARRYGDKYTELCASSWNITMGITVALRDCLNEANALEGAFITAREPTISYNPEAILAAQEPIWSYMEQGISTEWWVRHGTVNGNIVLFHAPNTQITNIGYEDRNTIRAFNIEGSLARLDGNDEIQILFT